jgi:imidazolonepropionase-like amidohydrolase
MIRPRRTIILKEHIVKALMTVVAMLAALPATAEVYAVKAGTLIDPATGSVTRNQTILVDNGTIKAVGTAVVVPAGAKTIDLSREFVMPGLMDAHTHLSLTELIGDAPFESFYIKESSTYRAMRAVHNGEVVLHQGFTTIRDLGNGADYAMMDVQRGIANGWFVGPTVLTTGKIITPFGGQSHSIPSEQGSFWKYEYLDADGPAEIRKAVRQNIYYGANVIKLVLDNSAYHYSVEEIRAAVDEAHHANIPVAVHVYGGEALDNAIEAGVDSIEHGFFLTDAQLKKMKEKGIALVGTDFPRAHLDIVGTSGGIFPEPKVLAPAIIDRLSRAYKIGVKIAFGSDTVIEMEGRTRADLMLDYLSTWRAAGIPPMAILKGWTSDVASVLRVEKSRGRVAEGFKADLIAMPADPLADLENLRHVDFVMKDGAIVRQDAAH